MPLYEYACDSCGHRFERIQKFSDPPASTCPKCGGPVQKLISSPAIQFKGSGWYITDYARAGKGGEGGGASSGAAKSSEGAKPAESKSAEGNSSSDAATPSTTKSGESTTSAAASAKPSTDSKS